MATTRLFFGSRIFLLLLLRSFLFGVCAEKLLILKQRLRLERLFNHEIAECVPASNQLSTHLWSTPIQPADSRKNDFDPKLLSSFRSEVVSIAFAETPANLIKVLQDLEIVQPLLWSIEYECLAPIETDITAGIEEFAIESSPIRDGTATMPETTISTFKSSRTAVDRKSFSSKTLFCAISQCIRGIPALDPREAKVFYYLLETQDGFHFGSSSEPLNPLDTRPNSMGFSGSRGEKMLTNNDVNSPSSVQGVSKMSTKEMWAGRPFIFSAALNIEIAEAVLNILQAKLRAKEEMRKLFHGNDVESRKSEFTVLDPCCGSGTTLFIARKLGFRAIGSDVNSAFVKGALENLKHAGFSLQDTATTSSTSTSPSTMSSVGEEVDSGDGPMLQLFVKDAAYQSTPWRPYDGISKNANDADVTTNRTEDICTSDLELTESSESLGKSARKQLDVDSYPDNNPDSTQSIADTSMSVSALELRSTSQSVSLYDTIGPSSSEMRSNAELSIPTSGRTKRFLQQQMVPRTRSDPVQNDPLAPWGIVDCVFCNFPWGENIFEYHNETENILEALGKGLKSGCECAFVTKNRLDESVLEERGFQVTKMIPIGEEKKKKRGASRGGKGREEERGEGLRYSKKSKNDIEYDDAKENTGDCVITFAVKI